MARAVVCSYLDLSTTARARFLLRTPKTPRNLSCRIPTNLAAAKWKSGLELKSKSVLGCDTSPSSVSLDSRSLLQHLLPSPGRGRRGVVSVRAARMVSKQVTLGFRAPDFELPEPLTGRKWKLDDFEDKQGLLVMFICNHCPFVVHLKESVANAAQEFQQKGLGVVAISSNSVESHPEDGPKYMAEDAKKYGYTFPYLYDETQEVAKAYGALCTPDFFLFRKDGRKPFELAYHGRYDETRPRANATPTGQDLKAAVNALLSAQPISSAQKPSIGCSIKWHP